MPDTRTIRMNYIADELELEGWYTKANSVRALVEERDKLLEASRNPSPRDYIPAFVTVFLSAVAAQAVMLLIGRPLDIWFIFDAAFFSGLGLYVHWMGSVASMKGPAG